MNHIRVAPHRPPLAVLRRAVEAAPERMVQSAELHAALEDLRQCVPSSADARPLEWFWRAASEPNPNVRKLWLATLLALIEGWFTFEQLPVAVGQEHAA